jgi:hypothetical protein
MDSLVIAGAFGYGYIVSGDNQDSDYDLNDRQGEFSRSNNRSDGDEVMDREVTLGFSFLADRPVHVAAGTGYANHTINLVMTDGYQTIATPSRTPPVGPIYNLHSTYSARLSGPVLWFEADWQFHPAVAVELKAKTGFYAYTGNADWNLRTDLAHPRSFSQHTNGRSDSISLSLGWLLSSQTTLLFNLGYESFRATGGYTRFYKSNGTTPQQPIREVKYWMWLLAAGIGVRF